MLTMGESACPPLCRLSASQEATQAPDYGTDKYFRVSTRVFAFAYLGQPTNVSTFNKRYGLNARPLPQAPGLW